MPYISYSTANSMFIHQYISLYMYRTTLIVYSEGFGVFFDYITSSMTQHHGRVRLVDAVYSAGQPYRDPTVMRVVTPDLCGSEVTYGVGTSRTILLGYRQSVKE